MNSNRKDDFDDDALDIVSSSQEQDIDLSEYERNSRAFGDEPQGIEYYDGKSEVGDRKGFKKSKLPIIIFLSLLGSGVLAYSIYSIQKMEFSTAKTEVEDPNKINKEVGSSKNFAEDFAYMQELEAKKQEEDKALAEAEENLNANKEPQVVQLQSTNHLDSTPPQYDNTPPPTPIIYTPPQPQPQQAESIVDEELIDPEQIEKNRQLKSEFGGVMSAKATYKADEKAENSNNNLSARMSNVAVLSSEQAKKFANRDLMIEKGSFISCALLTRFNSELAGMLTCEVTRNVYGASGRVILIERGSRITGQYQGDIENGLTRVFVIWDRVVTPKGVTINLQSPGTSTLGETGLTGRVNTHFWRNLGISFMVSLIGSSADATGESIGKAIGRKLDKALGNPTGTTTVDINEGSTSSGSPSDMAMKTLDRIGTVKPTITKNQGDRVIVYVARDLDFSTVYKLK